MVPIGEDGTTLQTNVVYTTNVVHTTNVVPVTNLSQTINTNVIIKNTLITNTSVSSQTNEIRSATYSTNINYHIVDLANNTFMVTAPSHVVVPRYDRSLHIVYQTDKDDSDIKFYFFDNNGRTLRVLTPGDGVDRGAKQAVWQFKPGDLDEKTGIVHVLMSIGGDRMLSSKQEIVILGDME
ncbi:MAG: hypothetical protein MPK62_11920 [Alphaproteobacteria bacterium]|nr:hypothetical protein [Alphaproteobacteria bacterium]